MRLTNPGGRDLMQIAAPGCFSALSLLFSCGFCAVCQPTLATRTKTSRGWGTLEAATALYVAGIGAAWKSS
jgi:hypothetical protein